MLNMPQPGCVPCCLRRSAVRRDGHTVRLDAADLVPGDMVILAAGDHIPADLQFSVTSLCTVDESMLTGESAPYQAAPQTRESGVLS